MAHLSCGNRPLARCPNQPCCGGEPTFLVPAWMVDPEAAAIKIVEVPRLSIVRLLDLRAFLDVVLACGPRQEILGEEADDQAWGECTTGSVRGAVAGHEARRYRAGEGRGAASGAADGGDGSPERSAGDRR